MEKLSTAIGTFIGVIIIGAMISIIMAWPVQLLWNACLAPAVEGINQIGFWQALGINVLFSIIFKSTNTSNGK
jgi:uncharacterized membrane protein YccC